MQVVSPVQHLIIPTALEVPLLVSLPIFGSFVLGFVIETVQVIVIRFHCNIVKYVTRNFFSCFLLLVDLYMLAMGIVYHIAVRFAVLSYWLDRRLDFSMRHRANLTTAISEFLKRKRLF